MATILDSRGTERGRKPSGWSAKELELSAEEHIWARKGDVARKRRQPARDLCHGDQAGFREQLHFQATQGSNYIIAVDRVNEKY